MHRVVNDLDGEIVTGSEVQLGLPEHLRPREYGRKTVAPVQLGRLVRLSQFRDGENPEIRAIQESIAARDLINQIDVARMPAESFFEYVHFVNRIWKAEHDPNLYQPDDEGFYHLVIAGHTRTEAIEYEELRKAKEAAALGFETDPYSATIWCKIHETMGPEEIIALQLDENLYKQPSEERRAMALVETYLFGVEVGKWLTKQEFMREAGGKFSRRTLEKALHFAELDPKLRDFVLSGSLKYGSAVELAQALPMLRKFMLSKYFDCDSEAALTEEQLVEFEEHVSAWAGLEIAKMQKNKLNVTAARKRFASYVKSWNAHLEARLAEQTMLGGGEPKQLDVFDLGGLMTEQRDREWRNEVRSLREEYARLLASLANEPLYTAALAVSLHGRIISDPETIDEIKGTLATRLGVFVENSGALVTEKAVINNWS